MNAYENQIFPLRLPRTMSSVTDTSDIVLMEPPPTQGPFALEVPPPSRSFHSQFKKAARSFQQQLIALFKVLKAKANKFSKEILTILRTYGEKLSLKKKTPEEDPARECVVKLIASFRGAQPSSHIATFLLEVSLGNVVVDDSLRVEAMEVLVQIAATQEGRDLIIQAQGVGTDILRSLADHAMAPHTTSLVAALCKPVQNNYPTCFRLASAGIFPALLANIRLATPVAKLNALRALKSFCTLHTTFKAMLLSENTSLATISSAIEHGNTDISYIAIELVRIVMKEDVSPNRIHDLEPKCTVPEFQEDNTSILAAFRVHVAILKRIKSRVKHHLLILALETLQELIKNDLVMIECCLHGLPTIIENLQFSFQRSGYIEDKERFGRILDQMEEAIYDLDRKKRLEREKKLKQQLFQDKKADSGVSSPTSTPEEVEDLLNTSFPGNRPHFRWNKEKEFTKAALPSAYDEIEQIVVGTQELTPPKVSKYNVASLYASSMKKTPQRQQRNVMEYEV
eukprot:m.71775 g.71775  ORF g.71775 m.71775 type:complete len:512 (+) comp12277_c0_seq1:159-1694(+)